MARKYNWRRVKIHFSYDIAQSAKSLNCSVATIRNWIKLGLPVWADQKPYLIDGRDLRAFARQKSEAQKWAKPKTNTPWNYFACFRCKAYRQALAEYHTLVFGSPPPEPLLIQGRLRGGLRLDPRTEILPAPAED